MPVRTKNTHGRQGEAAEHEPPAKRVRFDGAAKDQSTMKDNVWGKRQSSVKEDGRGKSQATKEAANSKATTRIRFTSVGELRAALKNPNPTTLVETLTAVRNQLSISPHEGPVAPQDARLLLAEQWMEISPGAQDLFNLWDNTTPRQPALPAIIVSVLACLLSILTTHYTHHASGHGILKAILTPQYLQKLNSYIGGGNNDLILAALKLYCAMAEFGSGREKKAVLEGFGWEIKAIPKLFTMRRRGKGNENVDTLKKPDIRTFFILFILSFVAPSIPSSTKTLFLSQHANVFSHIFKGLVQDNYSVIRTVFETIWAGIWADPKVGRTIKISLFGENTINHILKLYDRSSPEGSPSSMEGEEEIPADLAHHFLLAISTRPGVGICFRDRGWYPREAESDVKPAEGDERGGRGKIYNKILANIVKTLKVNEDARHQELAMKILAACPELVAGFPPPSSLVSPTPLYNPIPPPLSTHFTKGLQSASGLVQHCSALALIKCLEKYNKVQRELVKDDTSEASGLWGRRRREMEREARKRWEGGKEKDKENAGPVKEPNEVRKALLAEAAQRLMRVYQRSFPAVALEARYDIGKLLLGFEEAARKDDDEEEEEEEEEEDEEEDEEEEVEPAKRLDRVKQLHVLKLLQESEQFVWTGKAGSSTYFRILLTQLATTHHKAIYQAVFSLVSHLLSTSTLFSESSSEEAALWLASLPRTTRSADSESPDGAKLSDEPQAVITFLDDCVFRCLKVVYKYLEELDGLCKVEEGERSESHPSPLLMTVLEQLEAKVSRRLLTPSDALALATFVRKLVLRLCSLLSDLRLVRAFVEKIDSVFGKDQLWKEFPVASAAIRREVGMMRKYCGLDSWQDVASDTSDDVKVFLSEVEKLPIASKTKASYELVDWVRLVDKPLTATEVGRLSAIFEKLNATALSELVQYTEPRQGLLWDGMQITSRFAELRPFLTFEWLFIDAGPSQITDEKCRTVLTDVLFMQNPKLVDVKRGIRLISHWLARAVKSDVKKSLYLLLASICTASSSRLPAMEIYDLKEMVFVRAGIVKETMMLASVEADVDEGLSQLVKAALDAASPADRKIAFEISSYWLTFVRNELVKEGAHEVRAAYRWMKYLNSADLFDLVDNFANGSKSTPSPSISRLLNEALDALSLIAASQTEIERSLVHRLPQLLSLLHILPDSATLEHLIAVAVDGSLPVGADGRLLRVGDFENASIVAVVKHAKSRWTPHTLAVTSELPVDSFLTKSHWSDATVKIITGLMYRKHISKDMFISWLSTRTWASHEDKHIIAVLHAFFDTCNRSSGPLSGDNMSLWKQVLTYTMRITVNESQPFELRNAASFCTLWLLQLCAASRLALVTSFLQTLEKTPMTILTAELVSLGRHLFVYLKSDATDVAAAIIDRGIQWSTRALGNDIDAAAAAEILDELTDLLRLYGKAKPHLVETLISVVIQQQLANVNALQLVTIALQKVSLKPVVVNRFIQTVTQNPHFLKLCASASPENASTREALVDFLHELFTLHPNNTCQVSHIQPLIRIYHGTVSSFDLKILAIFQLFESERKLSVAPLLSQWSPNPNSPSTTSLEAIQSLDPALTLRTCLHFPNWRRMERQTSSGMTGLDSQLYDPVFVMLLFTQMLADGPPTGAFGWVELFRTNAVGLYIRALSSKDLTIREVALSQITALWKHLESADLQEKPHVLRILSLLKNVFPPPSEDEQLKRLPNYTTLLLMHALRGIFYPSNFIYPLTARFLLQRPELDTSDVPMLYGMLYSSSDDWKKERGWMLRFLSDGLVSRDDCSVFKRRHTWDLLASMFESTENDRALRHGVLEVLATVALNIQAATSLVLKSSLLSWVEMNIRESRTDQVEWVKIIENLLVTLDASKIESATNGQWREAICRCLLLLLVDRNGDSIFPLIVPLILRLSLLPGPSLLGLSSLLDEAVKLLEGLEVKVSIPRVTERVKVRSGLLPCPPHRAHGLHELPHVEDHLQLWGSSVEMLWRAAMGMHIIVWRAIAGEDMSRVGEWARAEIIRNIM
ncbi:ribosome 60S biogenesis N-terminal-domain-containing protein [Cyathus striatus]|nr:ribosome 60S biogenesis N-terminal-domain-containing protein [Cyathus striatus]